ncbi:PIN domain-containing protein [Sphingomonas cavernae]|uniref:PIN domain-containing protein n=1 Tax=Sphingomonas cavernae TaxID=2320861 RepID=A0A418WKT1_9SPHN|nr:PIN domain-containing protein [Sphingomonas cavernae]RJF90657.1 PIN domain-containing protein [Sphingomonas cavernae]
MISVDTNILVYAAAQDGDARNAEAEQLVSQLFLLPATVPVQVLAEFLNVTGRKNPAAIAQSLERVEEWLALFDVAPTMPADLIAAQRLRARYKMQFFDALICAVALRSGARILLSEDLQNGMSIDGLTVLNPFAIANRDAIGALFGASE